MDASRWFQGRRAGSDAESSSGSPDGNLINRDLLHAGCAKLVDKFGLPLELEVALRQAEAMARIERRGIWQR